MVSGTGCERISILDSIILNKFQNPSYLNFLTGNVDNYSTDLPQWFQVGRDYAGKALSPSLDA